MVQISLFDSSSDYHTVILFNQSADKINPILAILEMEVTDLIK